MDKLFVYIPRFGANTCLAEVSDAVKMFKYKFSHSAEVHLLLYFKKYGIERISCERSWMLTKFVVCVAKCKKLYNFEFT